MIDQLEKELAQIKYLEAEKAKLEEVLKDLNTVAYKIQLQGANLNEISQQSARIKEIVLNACVFKEMFNTTLASVLEYLIGCANKQFIVLSKKQAIAADKIKSILEQMPCNHYSENK